MRVLHILNNHRHGGGSDNSWAETIRLSRESGIDIEVFSRTSKDLSPAFRDKARAALSGVYAPITIRAAADAVARFRPDLVHTHELYPLISPWVIRRVARMGVPVVHTTDDYRLTCPVATHFQHGTICHRCTGGREYWAALNNCRDNRAESVAYAVRNAVARRFDLYRGYVSEFITQTEFGRQWLIRDVNVDPGRITVNACAVEVSPTPADPGQGDYIGYAGRFVPEKGVEMLVEAARRAGLPLRLAGNAETHPAIRPGDPVECVLTPTRESLMQFYRGARFLVAPSLWYETFGLVAAEAMAQGIPVLVSRIGALQNVVVDGVTGLLFEPGSVDDLVTKMSRLWNAPELCRQFGAAAYMHARNEFNGEAHMRHLMAAYERALSTRIPHPRPARKDRRIRPPYEQR
jgi:glycosyltransferase involved in cell wall biosynthesis